MFTVGERVQTHPGTTAWLSGDRYGRVVEVGRTLVVVKMDRSGRERKFAASRLQKV